MKRAKKRMKNDEDKKNAEDLEKIIYLKNENEDIL